VSQLEQRINDVMDRVHAAGEDHEARAAALEDYLRLAYDHEDDEDFDVGAWSETLAESYLALGRVQDAIGTFVTPPGAATARAPRCCVTWRRN
jgi:hypothetical protein